MTSQALKTILSTVGADPQGADRVEITGKADPVLPTPFLIGETASASLAAVGSGRLGPLETPHRPRPGRRHRCPKGDGIAAQRPLPEDGRRSRCGRTNAGNGSLSGEEYGRWSYLPLTHFPNHRDAALGVLGVPENREAVRRAVAEWDALELEEAIIAARGAGGMVRSMDEWAKHPQSAAVASLPLLEIEKIGDSPPEMLCLTARGRFPG